MDAHCVRDRRAESQKVCVQTVENCRASYLGWGCAGWSTGGSRRGLKADSSQDPYHAETGVICKNAGGYMDMTTYLKAPTEAM